jgi:tRNA (cytosine34-C5)-methyltransferase
VAEKQSSKMIF